LIDMLDLWIAPSWVGGLLGLMVGSFLNVLIYRLPLMLEAQWAEECARRSDSVPVQREVFNLMLPRSRCGHCGHRIAWFENIPLLSYLVLRGRCSACQQRFGWRYPLVEGLTGALFFFCVQREGLSVQALAWCVFSAAVLALAFIDWDTTLLPDDITLPLLWAGLLASALQWTSVDLVSSIWGAVLGYMSLWIVYWAFKLITGKEGMGYGDFKLFAALGAWFGWQALIPIILIASGVGAVIGIGLKFAGRLRDGVYIPFGPFLVLGGLVAMIWGPHAALRLLGL